MLRDPDKDRGREGFSELIFDFKEESSNFIFNFLHNMDGSQIL
jgi:hypothetical protein